MFDEDVKRPHRHSVRKSLSASRLDSCVKDMSEESVVMLFVDIFYGLLHSEVGDANTRTRWTMPTQTAPFPQGHNMLYDRNELGTAWPEKAEVWRTHKVLAFKILHRHGLTWRAHTRLWASHATDAVDRYIDFIVEEHNYLDVYVDVLTAPDIPSRNEAVHALQAKLEEFIAVDPEDMESDSDDDDDDEANNDIGQAAMEVASHGGTESEDEQMDHMLGLMGDSDEDYE